MKVVVVPSALGLLPCRGQVDPFVEMRAAAVAALSLLGRDVVLVGSALTEADRRRGMSVGTAERVGRSLLEQAGFEGEVAWLPVGCQNSRLDGPEGAVREAGSRGSVIVVVADGSARRSENAPGHLDPRASSYDALIGRALIEGDAASLAELDLSLGAELLAAGAPALRWLGRAWEGPAPRTTVSYDDDPFGVQYWVATWE